MSEEKTLTDEEIVKALEVCANRGVCKECPYTIKKIDCCEGRSEKDYIDFIRRLQAQNEEHYNRIMELEQDLVHADENVFYRECDVALNERKLKDKGALELAQEVEAYLAYYQGESFITEQILDIIKQTLIEDFNFKEQTNEN